MRRNSLAGQVFSLVVSLLIVAAGVVGFVRWFTNQRPKRARKAPATVPLVHTQAIRSHTGSLDIAVDGVVVPFREIEVAAEVAGKVVFKDEACNGGRFVTRGKRLIQIDPRDYEIATRRLDNQLEQANASLEELQVEISNTGELIKISQDQVDLEKNEIERLAGLIQERIVTDSTMDRAKQTELTARNNLVQLTNQLQLLKTGQRRLGDARELVVTDLEKAALDLQRTEIVAAVDGVVTDDLVEQGSFVQKGTPLFTLEDTSAVEVKCRLKMEELYWVWRQTGHAQSGVAADSSGYQIPPVPVTIRYRLSDRQGMQYEWQGVLARFDGMGLDEATRTVPCRVRVDAPRDVTLVSDREKSNQATTPSGGPPALVRGMFVTVTFHVDQPSALLLIPERAVQPGKAVWIVKENRLEEKSSLDLIELIQVKDAAGEQASYWLVEAAATGLAADDRVVVPPFGVLRDGEKVREDAAR